MKKLIPVLVVLAVVGALAYGLFHWFGGDKKDSGEGDPAAAQQQQQPTPEVGVITVEPKEVPITIELPGRLSAYKVAEIRPQVSGIITKRHFEEGAKVEKGQQLYQIDPAPYQAELARAEASLKEAEANIEALRSRQARYEELLKIGGVSKQEYDDAKAATAQGEAAVAVAKAAIKSARINVDYTRLMSPISGRIGKSIVTEGALVTAGQADALAVVTQLDPIYVDMTQSSTDMTALRKRFAGRADDENTKIPVTIIMEGEKEPHEDIGTLQFSEVTVDPGTGMVTLRAEFPNNGDLLPGMFVRALIEQSRIQNAILVPQAAVSRTPEGAAVVMVVGEDGKVAPRPVKTGEAIDGQWLITSGLSGGEQVIVEGLMKVKPGATVKTVPISGAQDASAAQEQAPPAEEVTGSKPSEVQKEDMMLEEKAEAKSEEASQEASNGSEVMKEEPLKEDIQVPAETEKKAAKLDYDKKWDEPYKAPKLLAPAPVKPDQPEATTETPAASVEKPVTTAPVSEDTPKTGVLVTGQLEKVKEQPAASADPVKDKDAATDQSGDKARGE